MEFGGGGEGEAESDVGLAGGPGFFGVFVGEMGDEAVDHLLELFVLAEEFHVVGGAFFEVFEDGENEDDAGVGELGLIVAFFFELGFDVWVLDDVDVVRLKAEGRRCHVGGFEDFCEVFLG